MGMMNSKAVGELCFEHDICIESIYWLAGSSKHVSSELEDFIEDDVDTVAEVLGIEADEDEELDLNNCDSEEIIERTATTHSGFIVRLSKGVGYGRRWDAIYSSDLSDIEAIIVSFGNRIDAELKAKAAKA
jgi:hypothetical protein